MSGIAQHIVIVSLAAVAVSSCWFPGNPMGNSSNHEPPPACPGSFPSGKPCKPEKTQFCVSKGLTYECYDDTWHPGSLAPS